MAIFSPFFAVNCSGAAALLSISPCCPWAEKSSATRRGGFATLRCAQNDSMAGKSQQEEFFFCRNDAGMLLKTKVPPWNLWVTREREKE